MSRARSPFASARSPLAAVAALLLATVLPLATVLMRPGTARADTRTSTLRIATVAPDGTSWAREIHAFSRELLAATDGAVGTKVYFGGIAGDDLQAAERVARGQLDGVFSGGILCMRLAPSMRALKGVGLFRSRAEADWVAAQLRPTFDAEFRRAGWVVLGIGDLGPSDVFSRRPIRSLADFKRERFWQWDTDDVQRVTLEHMGVPIVSLPLDQAAPAYASQRTDGFLSIPSATLAFQWSVQARYMTDLELSYLMGCVLVSARAFDRLTAEQQAHLRDAGARLAANIADVTRTQDEALLNGLFQHQGLVKVPASDAFRAELSEAALVAREKLGDKLAPRALQKRVTELVSEYRAKHSRSP